MSNKIKKLIFTAASALALAGMGVSVYATTVGISGTVTKTLLTGSFEYGRPGHTLRIDANFTEHHPGTNDYYTDTKGESAFGNNTGVAYSRNSDEGYEYTIVHFIGKVDGVEYTRLPDVTP